MTRSKADIGGSRTIQELIEENNRLREQLYPDNEAYYSNMLVYIRTSLVDERQGEELLLELLLHLLEAQRSGKDAREIFGGDPERYCKELVEQLPKTGVREQAQWLVMVPWISLTWYFFIQGLFGLISVLTGKKGVAEIPLMVLAAVGLSSLLFVWLILVVINKSVFQPMKRRSKWLLMLLHIVFIGAVVCAAIFGREWLPVWMVSPWICLAIFAAGLLGQRIFFRS